MKIALIGATGKSGKFLLKQLLHLGIPVKVLLRTPESLPIKSPLVEQIKGDARNYDAVHTLVTNCQAVISTLGQPAGESAIFSQATRNVLRAMDSLHIQRYILTTGLNVDTPSDRKGPASKFATQWMQTNYPETTKDKQEEYNLLSKSDVAWTLVRLPMIEQTDARHQIIVSLEDCPGDTISAADLAQFLFDQLSDETYLKKAPFIASLPDQS